jgi:hypothetical protein
VEIIGIGPLVSAIKVGHILHIMQLDETHLLFDGFLVVDGRIDSPDPVNQDLGAIMCNVETEIIAMGHSSLTS